jgi:hypothetical protein
VLSVGWSNEGKGNFKLVAGAREERVNRHYKATKLHETITIMSVCELVRLPACLLGFLNIREEYYCRNVLARDRELNICSLSQVTNLPK